MDREQSTSLLLPLSVVNTVDVGRLLREVEMLDNLLRQATVQQPGLSLKLPETSRLMDDTLAINKINVLRGPERAQLLSFLKVLRVEAPIVHISFSADPSPLFTEKIVGWLRAEIHPLLLLQIGLQPSIGAGCVIRTTNKYFDLSLQNRFKVAREILVQKIKWINKENPSIQPETRV